MSEAKVLDPEALRIETARLRIETARLIHRLGSVVTPRELARHLWRFRQVSAATALLETMVEAKMGVWLRLAKPGGGRPSRKFVLLDAVARRLGFIGETSANTEAHDGE